MREVTITEETRNQMKENIKQYEIYYKEIERLNNIINKTIKYCEESSMTLKSHYFEDVIKILKGEK